MKVYCIGFHEINKDKSGNALFHFVYKAFQELGDNYTLLTSFIDNNYGTNIIGHNSISRFFYKAATKILSKLHIPYYIVRTLQEFYIDFLHYLILRKEKESYILLTAMYSTFCTKLAKQKGNKVILLAGNLDDELYYTSVEKEKKRVGLSFTDVYCSGVRIAVYRKMMKNIDKVWCNSSKAKESFSKYACDVIRLPFYNNRNYECKSYNSIREDVLTLGYIGHTTLLKGVHILSEAIQLSKYREKIKLVIVGSVDGNVKRLVDSCMIDVEYRGHVPEPEKETIIKSFDYMCVPSLYDAGPTTIYEALECNVPLIVSDGCGGSEFIKDNPHCFIFKTTNVNDLKEKIEYIFEHKRLLLKEGMMMNDMTGLGNIDSVQLLKNKLLEL